MFLSLKNEIRTNVLGSIVVWTLFYISSGLNITSDTGGHHQDDSNTGWILAVVTVIIIVAAILIFVVLMKYRSRMNGSRSKDHLELMDIPRLDISRRNNIKEIDMFQDSFLGLQHSVRKRHTTTKYYAKGGEGPSTSTMPVYETKSEAELAIPSYTWTGNRPKGLIVIIGIDTFDHKDLCYLAAVKKDIKMVQAVFQKLDFEVEVCTEVEQQPIEVFLKTISESDNSKYDCFACYISSHGVTNYVCCKEYNRLQNKGKLEIRYIIELFLNDTCISFAGKPKLFFFDFCLGSNTHEDAVIEDGGREFASSKTEKEAFDHILTFYATIFGFVSWADKDGSWFTKALTQIISKSNPGHTMTELVYATCNIMEENNKDTSTPAQTPTFSNKLTKNLFLKKN